MPNNYSENFATQYLEPFDHNMKRTISNLSLIDLGVIGHIREDGTCTVQSYRVIGGRRLTYYNVEIILPGGIGSPVEGTNCLVLRPVVNMVSLKNNLINTSSEPYSPCGAKCIPILTINSDNITAGVDSFGNFSVSGNGVSFTVSGSEIKIHYGTSEYIWSGDGTSSSIVAGGNIDTSSDEGELAYRIYKSVENEGDESPLVFSFLLDLKGGIYITATEESDKTAQIALGNNIIRVNDNDRDDDDDDVNAGKHIYLEDANRDPDDDESHGNIVSLNESGITITDIHENTIKLKEEGITISDSNFDPDDDSTHPNQITTTENGIEILDANDNNVTLNADGITVTDANDNNITLSSTGTEIKDANDNNITLSSTGTEIKDANGNTITLDSSGVNIEDANGNTLTLDASGISGTATSLVTIGNSSSTIGSLLQDLATQLSTVVITDSMGGPCTSTLPAIVQTWATSVSSVLG